MNTQSTQRSFQERAMKRALPQSLADPLPPLVEVAPGLWTLEREYRHFGFARLPAKTTLVRLGSGRTVVISPPAASLAATVDAIVSLGAVEHVVVPNSFHYVYAGDFMQSFPDAELLLAPGVRERVPALSGHAELKADPPAPWEGVLDYVVLGPVGVVSEVLFFHRPSASLILTDLAFNMTKYARALDRAFWRLSGFPKSFGHGRTSRALLLRDREVASEALDRVLKWPFERILVAHGDVIEDDARGEFERAFAKYLHTSRQTSGAVA